MSSELALAASPTMPPIEIDATPLSVDLTAQREWVEAVRDLYREADVSSLSVADAKRERASLNAFGKQLAAFRAEVRRRNEARVAGLLDDLRAMEDAIRDASSVVDARVKDIEAEELRARTDALRGAYEEFAPALVPVVPFERLVSGEKWLNKTFGEAKAQDAMREKVSMVARAWDMLKADGLPADALKVAERTLFETLSYERARREADAYMAERERIDAMRAQVAPEPEPTPEPEQRPAQAEEPARPAHVPEVRELVEDDGGEFVWTLTKGAKRAEDFVLTLKGVTWAEAKSVLATATERVGERVRLYRGDLFRAMMEERMGR